MIECLTPDFHVNDVITHFGQKYASLRSIHEGYMSICTTKKIKTFFSAHQSIGNVRIDLGERNSAPSSNAKREWVRFK
jgi:hypothetical protein